MGTRSIFLARKKSAAITPHTQLLQGRRRPEEIWDVSERIAWHTLCTQVCMPHSSASSLITSACEARGWSSYQGSIWRSSSVHHSSPTLPMLLLGDLNLYKPHTLLVNTTVTALSLYASSALLYSPSPFLLIIYSPLPCHMLILLPIILSPSPFPHYIFTPHLFSLSYIHPLPVMYSYLSLSYVCPSPYPPLHIFTLSLYSSLSNIHPLPIIHSSSPCHTFTLSLLHIQPSPFPYHIFTFSPS